MTLRFAAAVLLMCAVFAVLLWATQTQLDYNHALSSRLDPLPAPRPLHAFHHARG